jgi:hypothetical protein
VLLVLAVAVLPLVPLFAAWTFLTSTPALGLPAVVAVSDLGVYFRESGWAVGNGTLFVTIRSEYPLAANLLFAAVRLLSSPLAGLLTERTAFMFTWVAVSWWVLLAAIHHTVAVTSRRTLWLWLAPGVVYFAVLRYDIYPVMATFLCLLAARDRRPLAAAAWLGLAIALKGYALYALPAFTVWAWYGWGMRRAAGLAVVAALPLAVSLGVAYLLGGYSAMVMPFAIQAARRPNGQGTWDVVQGMTRIPASRWIADHPQVATILTASGALLAAALRPRTFPELNRGFIIAFGAFVTFSVFYSPQYVMWFVPMAALGSSVWFFRGIVVWGWLSIVHYPLVYASGRFRLLYKATLVVEAIVRTAAFAVALARPAAIPPPAGGDAPVGPDPVAVG